VSSNDTPDVSYTTTLPNLGGEFTTTTMDALEWEPSTDETVSANVRLVPAGSELTSRSNGTDVRDAASKVDTGTRAALPILQLLSGLSAVHTADPRISSAPEPPTAISTVANNISLELGLIFTLEILYIVTSGPEAPITKT
jgi:hypothetical protein